MKKLFTYLVLLGDSTTDSTTISKWDRLKYAGSVFVQFAPVAYLLDLVKVWFNTNKQFGTFMCIALIANAIFGVWMHKKNRTFTFEQFFKRNMLMAIIVSSAYLMLEMLRLTVGENIAGELFRVSIQIMSLLYPISKVIKNIFILSNGTYPPEFLMRKLYNFEKNGDLEKFFSTKQEDLEKDPDFEKWKEEINNKKNVKNEKKS